MKKNSLPRGFSVGVARIRILFASALLFCLAISSCAPSLEDLSQKPSIILCGAWPGAEEKDVVEQVAHRIVFADLRRRFAASGDGMKSEFPDGSMTAHLEFNPENGFFRFAVPYPKAADLIREKEEILRCARELVPPLPEPVLRSLRAEILDDEAPSP